MKLSELCARKSQIDEKRIETLEAALKQMTLNYQHSKQQLSKQQNGKHQSNAVHKSPGTSENDLRASPVTGLRCKHRFLNLQIEKEMIAKFVFQPHKQTSKIMPVLAKTRQR